MYERVLICNAHEKLIKNKNKNTFLALFIKILLFIILTDACLSFKKLKTNIYIYILVLGKKHRFLAFVLITHITKFVYPYQILLIIL